MSTSPKAKEGEGERERESLKARTPVDAEEENEFGRRFYYACIIKMRFGDLLGGEMRNSISLSIYAVSPFAFVLFSLCLVDGVALWLRSLSWLYHSKEQSFKRHRLHCVASLVPLFSLFVFNFDCFVFFFRLLFS